MNRGSLGRSHSSSEEVYQSTTSMRIPMKPSKKPPLISRARKNLTPLLDNLIIVPHENPSNSLAEKLKNLLNMPGSSGEEAALMGVSPLEDMDGMEMRNIQLHLPSVHRSASDGWCEEFKVRTDRGDLLVAVQGDRGKTPILTYHDLGLTYQSFQQFFNYVDMRALLENFCVYHVTAPGQEEGATAYPVGYVYPSMDELARQLNFVMVHFQLSSFIGFGVGAGANVLARFALVNPHKVDALALVNCTASTCGWVEWLYQKRNLHALRYHGVTQTVLDYLMWHHFGREINQRNPETTEVYRSYFARHINPINLALFIDSYVRRNDLAIQRDQNTIKVPVLNITGAYSPHVDDTVALNARLNPNSSSWIKISDCAMVVEEQPGKLSEAFRLFVQGEGFVAPLSPTKIVQFRRRVRRPCRHGPTIHITENPIPEPVAC